MVGRTSDWEEELGRFLKPFLDRLGHKARRQMCPLYVSGLIGPGDRPRTSHGCVRTTWLPPVSSHLASAGAGPERYAAVVKPPGRGDFWILKVTQGPFPESAARFDFGQVGAPDLWVT
jgi:hypothetical protein